MTIAPRLRIAASLLVLPWVALPQDLSAQSARVGVDENIRAEPNGTLLGRLSADTSVEVVQESGEWAQVVLTGWVWTRSLRTVDRQGYDLIVSVEEGENIRASPSGAILGRLDDAVLLEEMERVPGWIRVRRAVWIWGESLEGVAGASGDDRMSASDAAQRFRTVGEEGMPLLMGPGGDTIAALEPLADIEILAREGSWARVRLEGWVWAPLVEEGDEEPATVLTDVTPSEVSENAAMYRGRIVEWELQFVSIERAEKIRTDFYEGEPFLLLRTTDDVGMFVYAAIPPERLNEVGDLTALELVRVVGRIRVGSARLTGSPIIDVLELGPAAEP